jgi:hypothetical protein
MDRSEEEALAAEDADASEALAALLIETEAAETAEATLSEALAALSEALAALSEALAALSEALAALEALASEALAALEALASEALAALDALASEALAALEALATEALVTLAALASEALAALEALASATLAAEIAETLDALAALSALSELLTGRTISEGRLTVDNAERSEDRTLASDGAGVALGDAELPEETSVERVDGVGESGESEDGWSTKLEMEDEGRTAHNPASD